MSKLLNKDIIYTQTNEHRLLWYDIWVLNYKSVNNILRKQLANKLYYSICDSLRNEIYSSMHKEIYKHIDNLLYFTNADLIVHSITKPIIESVKNYYKDNTNE